jgi:trans-aconitate methyltransferase
VTTTDQTAARGDFQGQTCSAPEERTRRMAEAVLRHVDRGRALRILDLGCGTGQLAFRLRDALPAADILGLDISAANVEAANLARSQRADQDRLRFMQADYLVFRDDPFDLVVTDGVLHLIPVDDETLVPKLAADTRAGGLLVVCMPYTCAYNSAFAVARRMLRALRGPTLDRVIKTAGHLLHPDVSDDMLLERVHYMYRPPERVMGPPLAKRFVASGLEQRATHPMPSSSLAQLRHNVTVWQKTAQSS